MFDQEKPMGYYTGEVKKEPEEAIVRSREDYEKEIDELQKKVTSLNEVISDLIKALNTMNRLYIKKGEE